MSQAYRILSQFKFRWKAQSKYAVHAPFAFDFYTKVICAKQKLPLKLNTIESLRKTTLREHAKAIRKQIPSCRDAFLLYRIVEYIQPTHILEIGTSEGIAPMFMMYAQKEARLINSEEKWQLAKIAHQNQMASLFLDYCIAWKNEIITPEEAKQNLPLGVVYFSNMFFGEDLSQLFVDCLPFVDENSVFIFSRIHTSKLMENTWNEIIRNENISLSLDIFHFGIVFFKKNIAKQHFNLKY